MSDPGKKLMEAREAESARQRRRKIIYVRTRYVADLFTRGHEKDSGVTFPDPCGLPATAITICAHHDYARDAFAIVVQDDSFDEVSDGCMYPELRVDWKYMKLVVKPML